MHLCISVILSICAREVAAALPIPRPLPPPAPRPLPAPRPDIPKTPQPIGVPGNPVDPGRMPEIQPNNPSSRSGVQPNLGRLEQKLEVIHGVIDVAQEVVKAILENPTSTGTPNPTSNVTFTPTGTLPISSYAACTSYASLLKDCGESTSSFFSMAPTAQASCACYTTTMPVTVSCGPSSTQLAAQPTLDVNGFDYLADSCHEYLDLQGYKKAAEALSGSQGNKTILGAGFCRSINAQLKSGSFGNGTKGLEELLKPSPYTQCTAEHKSTSATGIAPRTRGLTNLDRVLFATTSMVVAVFSYVMFS